MYVCMYACKCGIPEAEIGYTVILISSLILWDAITEKPRA